MLLRKAPKIATLVEIPLFLSLVLLIFGFEKGPHNPAAMVLMMTQIVGVIVMSVFGSTDSGNATLLALVWAGIFVVQFILISMLAYLLLKSMQRNT
jgi:hypothetical protein